MLLESLFSWIHSNFLQSILILLWKIYSVTVLLWFPEHISLLYNLVWLKKFPTFKLYLCLILSCLWFFSFLPQEQSWETSSLVVGHGHTRNSLQNKDYWHFLWLPSSTWYKIYFWRCWIIICSWKNNVMSMNTDFLFSFQYSVTFSGVCELNPS